MLRGCFILSCKHISAMVLFQPMLTTCVSLQVTRLSATKYGNLWKVRSSLPGTVQSKKSYEILSAVHLCCAFLCCARDSMCCALLTPARLALWHPQSTEQTQCADHKSAGLNLGCTESSTFTFLSKYCHRTSSMASRGACCAPATTCSRPPASAL